MGSWASEAEAAKAERDRVRRTAVEGEAERTRCNLENLSRTTVAVAERAEVGEGAAVDSCEAGLESSLF